MRLTSPPCFGGSLKILLGMGASAALIGFQKELMKGNDQLAGWAKGNSGDAFRATSEADVIAGYRVVMGWVNDQKQFSEAAKEEFAKGADGWLIAYAKTKRYVIVTEERLNPVIKRKVPIPNVYQAFRVRYVDTFGMLRELGVRFS